MTIYIYIYIYIYTVNQKKTWQFIFDYNFGYTILTDFYSFYIILIVKKFYKRL